MPVAWLTGTTPNKALYRLICPSKRSFTVVPGSVAIVFLDWLVLQGSGKCIILNLLLKQWKRNVTAFLSLSHTHPHTHTGQSDLSKLHNMYDSVYQF